MSRFMFFIARSTIVIGFLLLVPSGAVMATDQTRLVTFSSKQIFPLDAVMTMALRVGIPLGIEFGESDNGLCSNRRDLAIDKQDASHALHQAVEGTGYTVAEQNGVIVLRSPRISDREMSLLQLRYSSFPVKPADSMYRIGVQLTEWMQMEGEHVGAFAAAIPIYHELQENSLGTLVSLNTVEIANRIVTQNGAGIWLFRPYFSQALNRVDYKVSIYSYAINSPQIEKIACEPGSMGDLTDNPK